MVPLEGFYWLNRIKHSPDSRPPCSGVADWPLRCSCMCTLVLKLSLTGMISHLNSVSLHICVPSFLQLDKLKWFSFSTDAITPFERSLNTVQWQWSNSMFSKSHKLLNVVEEVVCSLFFTSTCPVLQIPAQFFFFSVRTSGGLGGNQLCVCVFTSLWIIWRAGTEENERPESEMQTMCF